MADYLGMRDRDAQYQECIGERLANVETLTAWPDGRAPRPEEIYTPYSHTRVFDLDRTLVVGNRGVGKTFWSNALVDNVARNTTAAAYPKMRLDSIADATFGYQAGIVSGRSPSKEGLQQAVEAGIKPETIWLAIALRAFDNQRQPRSRLVDYARAVADDPDDAQIRLRAIARRVEASGKRNLLVFDGLDRLGDSWDEIRPLTEGLFRFAISVRGIRGLSLKIFVRPDQLLDPRIKGFPDASKLLSERVDLRWHPLDLYGLMFFHLWRYHDSRRALVRLADDTGLADFSEGSQLPFQLRRSPNFQKELFISLAGEWMGANKKRGSTFSWLPQHLADARDETSPRSFLKALSVAASAGSKIAGQALDYVGIKEGVVAASVVRIEELSEDYWWISEALEPLKGITVPCERELIFECWREDRTVSSIRRDAGPSNLLPLLFGRRLQEEEDVEALLLTLREIAVVEIRPNLKINIPDIFRVGAGIKRRGGVRPPKRG